MKRIDDADAVAIVGNDVELFVTEISLRSSISRDFSK